MFFTEWLKVKDDKACYRFKEKTVNFLGQLPNTRPRRLRAHGWLRDMVQETRLHSSDLVLPLFIRVPETSPDIASMPGVRRWAIAELPQIINQILEAGILAIDLFPLVPQELKPPVGKEAFNPENLICQAVHAIKKMAQKGMLRNMDMRIE